MSIPSKGPMTSAQISSAGADWESHEGQRVPKVAAPVGANGGWIRAHRTRSTGRGPDIVHLLHKSVTLNVSDECLRFVQIRREFATSCDCPKIEPQYVVVRA